MDYRTLKMVFDQEMSVESELALASELCDALYRIIADTRVPKLRSSQERIVADVGHAFEITDLHDFRFLFSLRNELERVIHSFEIVGAPLGADIIRRGVAIFPNSKAPTDVGETTEFLERAGGRINQDVEDLAKEFAAAKDDAKRSTGDYILRNTHVFAPVVTRFLLDYVPDKLLTPPVPFRPLVGAYCHQIISWLRDIDATFLAGEESDTPFEQVELAPQRETTDEEIRQLTNVPAGRNIDTLSLQSTRVSIRGIEYLLAWERLKTLDLSGTNACDQWLPVVSSIRSLEVLCLESTQVTNIDALASLPEIVLLGLDETSITDDGLKSIEKFDKIEYFSACSTRISDLTLQRLSQCKNLKNLLVRETDVSDSGIANLAPLCELTELDLKSTNVTGLGLASLSHLSEFSTLEMGHGLTDEGLECICQLPYITTLGIRSPKISFKAMIKLIEEMPKLESVYLPAHLSNAGSADALRKIRPNLDVY